MEYGALGFSRESAWKRLGAKVIDLTISNFVFTCLFILILLLVATVVNEGNYSILINFISTIPNALDRLITIFISCSVLIPMQTYYLGNTCGKKLFGIKVKKMNGDNLSFRELSQREVKIFFLGLFFPFLSSIYQYFAFKRNGILSWDREMNLVVSYDKYKRSSLWIRGVICIFVVIGINIISTLII